MRELGRIERRLILIAWLFGNTVIWNAPPALRLHPDVPLLELIDRERTEPGPGCFPTDELR
ncbi:hypothetical protein C0Z16_33530 [Paraburkholderia rhynchosiae]|uniref:Uncharacterized protein n=1 Tax=Paraburkholderia rhynchosiae TaxID=487049 RepID=A0ABX4UUL6_9BURK|nr:hypothetical protein C0Z16_33530 [Paraburkholderia rhynchosiae]